MKYGGEDEGEALLVCLWRAVGIADKMIVGLDDEVG